MVTRTGFVVKNEDFSSQNDDENGARRKKVECPASKRRRERGSSPKNDVFHPKMVTRTGLVAKK
ncbi:hypothetical protein [Caldifermentibacillus hisashii]|uniref:hypothetical protein n=1 Tax=Caldifermentibacillus hisashii TaxID=996558 RepID=UPI0031015413